MLGADPADEPVDGAVLEHQRNVPAVTLVGRWARTTVAVTNDVPSPASSWALRDMAGVITAAAPAVPASPPTRAPGCRACRCDPRRGSRAARR